MLPLTLRSCWAAASSIACLTRRYCSTLEKKVNWGQLRDNLDGGKGWAHGAGIVTTSPSSGRTIIFLQGKGLAHPPADDVRGIDYVPVSLAAPHVVASAAIPMASRG